MGLSLKLETQQRARGEVKAHTIWFDSEASVPLQRQTTPDEVSHSSLLAYCKQQDSCCQEKNFMMERRKLQRDQSGRERESRS